ncbi:helix-turn-helix domain-containing protein [Actinomadura logoneensis]|uniref:Helix-turn-helix domain-containing protein n=1 Tax=Actinomadura logoneensis TaxID=2293572 RepID=A0A372JAG1_9ACTN|nr:helix-turn-helix domain-containing protein [Actinomadura logoneensis]RFU36806.1 helix-turn-helix domain-containing protein [Actinomadura logoneensis]
MYDTRTRELALALLDQGLTLSEAARQTGASRAAVREWRLRRDMGIGVTARKAECPRCVSPAVPPEEPEAYGYLLGLYLGDGCISRVGRPDKGVWSLRIICADAWPGLVRECAEAMRAVRPANKVRLVPKQGCVEVNSHSKHWPCLFPQHGAGKKHERRIELAPWQNALVRDHPEAFIRGLLHSDGTRFVNRVRRPLPSGDRWYEYPRYNFTNLSDDIRCLFTDALDLLHIPWRRMNRVTVSVARAEGVARLDEFVGPKY